MGTKPPPAYNDCQCPCHRDASIKHIVACCAPWRVGQGWPFPAADHVPPAAMPPMGDVRGTPSDNER